MRLLNIDTHDKFSVYNIALFTIVFMSIQNIPLEGYPISTPKVIFMAISPLICLMKAPGLTKAMIWSCFFWIVTVSMSVLQFGMPRMSTFYYTALYLLVFNLYYNLIYLKHAFTLKEFINVLKFIIYTYFVFLILQEIALACGIRMLYIINLGDYPYLEVFRAPSINLEPSISARVLCVCFYCFLKCIEYQLGEAPSLDYLYRNERKVIFCFLYTMIAMGSGTAFVCLAILSLYFLKRQYAFAVVVLGLIIYNVIPLIDYEPLTRAINIFDATLTGDEAVIAQTDGSAAARVNILVGTVKYLDLTDARTWLGMGVDATMTNRMSIVSGIMDYGLISYLLKLGMFFSCCFLDPFSLEVLMYFLIFGMNIGNIAYGWAALMMLTTVKYFRDNKEFHEDEYCSTDYDE